MIYHSIIFAIAMLGVSTNEPWLVWIGILELLSFRRIPVARFIQSKLITTAQCPHCSNKISLINHWQCACGYISQISQHVFAPCIQCGRDFTFINCHYCGVGILT